MKPDRYNADSRRVFEGNVPVFVAAATNTGTLPSKTLRESALYLSGFNQRGLYGIDTKLKDKVTADDFLYREKLVAQSERARITENIKRHDIDLIHGKALPCIRSIS